MRTIDGATTTRLPPGYSCMIECNGTSLRTVWQLPQMDSSPAETSADYNIDIHRYNHRVYTVRGQLKSSALPSALPMGIGNKFKIINRSTTNTLTVVDNTGYPVYRLAALKSIDAVLKNNLAGGSVGGGRGRCSTTGGIVRSGAVTTLLASKVCHAASTGRKQVFLHVASGSTAGTLQFVVSTVSGLTITIGTPVTISGAVGDFVQLLPVTGAM